MVSSRRRLLSLLFISGVTILLGVGAFVSWERLRDLTPREIYDMNNSGVFLLEHLNESGLPQIVATGFNKTEGSSDDAAIVTNCHVALPDTIVQNELIRSVRYSFAKSYSSALRRALIEFRNNRVCPKPDYLKDVFPPYLLNQMTCAEANQIVFDAMNGFVGFIDEVEKFIEDTLKQTEVSKIRAISHKFGSYGDNDKDVVSLSQLGKSGVDLAVFVVDRPYGTKLTLGANPGNSNEYPIEPGDRVQLIGHPGYLVQNALINEDQNNRIELESLVTDVGIVGHVDPKKGFYFSSSITSGGVSGSPIFNSKGYIVGVLSSGIGYRMGDGQGVTAAVSMQALRTGLHTVGGAAKTLTYIEFLQSIRKASENLEQKFTTEVEPILYKQYSTNNYDALLKLFMPVYQGKIADIAKLLFILVGQETDMKFIDEFLKPKLKEAINIDPDTTCLDEQISSAIRVQGNGLKIVDNLMIQIIEEVQRRRLSKFTGKQ